MGSIRGVVYDRDFEASLAGARVTIAETGQEATTSSEGNYVLPDVAPGAYTLVFSKEGFARQVKSDVVVSAGQLAEADAWLTGDFTEMDEFIVQDLQLEAGSEAALLQLRIESPSLVDSISADLMKMAGTSDAASALRLVAGATVADGKFAVIRGLPDRYVSSQLNNVRLPSADADTRAVELDQFPDDVIESMQISKTFTPDQQGDASGGAVNVVLKGIPDENIFEIGVGTEINTQVVGRDDFLSYADGGVGAFGMDQARKQIPVAGVSGGGDKTLAEPGAFGVGRDSAPLEYGFDLTAGGRHTFDGGLTVGGLLSFFYERDATFYDNGIDDSRWLSGPVGETLTPQVTGNITGAFQSQLLDVTEGSEKLNWGGLGTLGLEIENHALTLAFMHTRSASDTATLAEDTRGQEFFTEEHEDDINAAPFVRFETLKYVERLTQSLQLSGEHTLPLPEIGVKDAFTLRSPEFDWTVSRNKATLDEPDERLFASQWKEARGGTPAAHFPLNPTITLGNVQRIWESIDENSTQYSLNLKLPFQQWSNEEGYVKVGVFGDEVTREFRQESFSNFGQSPGGGFQAPFEELFSAGFDDWPGAQDITDDIKIDVDYDGEQNIFAWYYMVDLPITSFFKVIGGARFESTEISIVNQPERDAKAVFPGSGGSEGFFGPFGDRRVDDNGLPLGDSLFEQDDVLPSVGFVFTPIEQITFRGSYTETVARQTFKELSPVARQEFLGSDVFVGNPELQMSALRNYDLRLDYRPYEGGLVSVSWFKKDIEKPIELVQRFATNLGRFTTPVNYPQGELSGLEFEVRQELGRFWEALEGLTVGANATFIDSEVDLPEEDIRELDRALVGVEGRNLITSRQMVQAPEHLFNINLTYELQETGTRIGLFYTIKGDTLMVGPGQKTGNFVPGIVQEEFDTLNLTISQKIGENINIKFSAKNLTNPSIREVYRSDFIAGDETRSSFTKGIDLSLSVSANFTF